MGLKWAYGRLRVLQIADFDFLRNYQSQQLQNLIQHSPQQSLHFHCIWRHQLLSVGSKSHKHVYFRSCFGGDFSITVQMILKKFTVLEIVIQGLHFLLYNLLDSFAPWPQKMGAQVDLPTLFTLRSWLIAVFSLYTSLHYVNGRCPIVVAVNSPIRVNARFRKKW